MNSVTVSELNRQTAKVLERVKSGESLEVSEYGRPIARLVPATTATGAPLLDRLIAQGRAIPAAEPGPIPPTPLGLASALAPRGTAGILASVGPVNDQATTELMLALHEQLKQGRTLAEAICAARASSDENPVATATGWSFIALGGA